jgi:hypothetical protein
MNQPICLGHHCNRTRFCRLHVMHNVAGIEQEDRLCKMGATDSFEPLVERKPAGTWEGDALPNTSTASIFWMAAGS